MKSNITIKRLEETDIPRIPNPYSKAEENQKKWKRHYQEQCKNKRIAFLLLKKDKVIGYASLLRFPSYLGFRKAKIPEINELWIADSERKKGFATHLIQHIEKVARKEGYKQIGIGVGLYADYGPAQRLYYKLGFMLDGNGVTYLYKKTTPGDLYPLDDHFLIWLTKKLTRSP